MNKKLDDRLNVKFDKICLKLTDKKDRRDWQVKQLTNVLIEGINKEKNWSFGKFNTNCRLAIFIEISLKDSNAYTKVEIKQKIKKKSKYNDLILEITH